MPERSPHVMGDTVRQLVPADGDWFQVEIVYDSPDPDRVFLSRVVCWALVEAPDKVDHVVAVGPDGTPHVATGHRPFTDTYFVRGCDQSPCGVLWGVLYAGIKPSSMNVVELMGEALKPFHDRPAATPTPEPPPTTRQIRRRGRDQPGG